MIISGCREVGRHGKEKLHMVTEILGGDKDAYNLDCDDFKGTHEHQNLSNFTLK